ncbi:MAG: HEPN domain-containing protein, partial [Deltaproteobacteria bacterium]|nr:HEPN domain-containing protein [Deltaproteobacteria bacterium]
MRDETKTWLTYAEENFKSSKILLKNKLYNPCLQNVQQTVEKALK